MKKFVIPIVLTCACMHSIAQTSGKLPYRIIPDYPNEFTAATVAARVVDGVGFRYYWATEGLRPEDLSFKPGDDARTTQETLIHVYELTLIIVNSVKGIANETASDAEEFTFEQLRERTLANVKETSDMLKADPQQDLNKFKIVFKRGDQKTEFPFWNQLNGPISDALWHIGQVVTFRRSSGNPFNSNVSVLQGRVRE